MSLTLAIPTLNQYHLLENCIRSALSGTLIPDTIFIVDNGLGLPQSVRELCGDKLIYYTEFRNLGVAKSWNFILQIHKQHPILIANDDLEFGQYDLASFYAEYAYHQKMEYVGAGFQLSPFARPGIFYPQNISPLNMFSCFMLTPQAIAEVGYFDERFYPAYFEDCDYGYRLMLAGFTTHRVQTEIKHMGSATVRSLKGKDLEDHHKTFNENRKYYIAKWGGMPHEEKLRTPFNK